MKIFTSSTSKICTKCGEAKSVEAFPNDHRMRSGLSPQCRACHAIRARRSYFANREERLAKSRAWRAANPEKLREYAAKRGKNR